MKFLQAVVVVAVLSVASTYEYDLSAFWNKRAALKRFEACLTTDGMKAAQDALQRAIVACDSASHDEQPVASVETANWNKILSEFSPGRYFRLNDERIQNIKAKMSSQVKRFRCIVQHIGVTDADNKIAADVVAQQYEALDLPPVLLNDLLLGVNQCFKMAECMPVSDRINAPVPADVLRTRTFLDCERYARDWACLKNELSADVAAGKFDFSGAEGTLDFLPDDEARAAAIVIADEWEGGDDYGLLE